MKKAALLLLFITAIYTLYPVNVQISQVDTSRMLINQKVGLYVRITGAEGQTVENADPGLFSIAESADQINYRQVEGGIFLEKGVNAEKGINYLLLVDNSGSMYFTMDGKYTKDYEKTRMASAREAIGNFLNSVTGENDTVGLAVYNSDYTLYSGPVAEKDSLYTYLEQISKPEGDEGWSEVYGSLNLAIHEFSRIKGRRVLIILSDGENKSFYKNTGLLHSRFGDNIIEYTLPIEGALEEGVSVFAIHYGKGGSAKDKHLQDIAFSTGGLVFDARSREELEHIYTTINELVLDEYYLTYNAAMIPAEKKYLRLSYKDPDVPGEERAINRYYFSSIIFGLPIEKFTPLLFLAFLAACLALFLLSLIKFRNRTKEPTLQVLSTGRGVAATRIIKLDQGTKIIGASQGADMTIMAKKADLTKAKDVTVVYDKRKNNYTLVAEEGIEINNKKRKKKVLEPGDLINVGGATIVYDKGNP